MVAFFCKQAKLPVVQKDAVDVLPVEDLHATPTGQTNEAGAVPIYEFIAQNARESAQNRQRIGVDQLRQKLTELLALPKTRSVPHYRIPRPVHTQGEVHARYAVETEGGIRAILPQSTVLTPPIRPASTSIRRCAFTCPTSPPKPIWPKTSGRAPSKRHVRFTPLMCAGWANRCRRSTGAISSTSTAWIICSTPTARCSGRATWAAASYDLLCVLDLLAHEGAEAIHLYGRGQGAILALLGALFHDNVASVTINDAPKSFLEWTQTPYVTWPAANFVRGMLRVCDLPDILDVLGDKVTVIGHWGPTMA